jgi:hypothetical protein
LYHWFKYEYVETNTDENKQRLNNVIN